MSTCLFVYLQTKKKKSFMRVLRKFVLKKIAINVTLCVLFLPYCYGDRGVYKVVIIPQCYITSAPATLTQTQIPSLVCNRKSCLIWAARTS